MTDLAQKIAALLVDKGYVMQHEQHESAHAIRTALPVAQEGAATQLVAAGRNMYYEGQHGAEDAEDAAARSRLTTPQEIAMNKQNDAGGVDFIGLALDLEARAKTVESQTTERAMLDAAQCLRLIASAFAAPVAYGCHCDLEDGMQPDGCVIDEGRREDCVYARSTVKPISAKEECEYWQLVKMLPSPPAIASQEVGHG